MRHIDISEIAGFSIGHATNAQGGTGCTVILCDKAAIGAVDVRGGAPATRETDLLDPQNANEGVNAVFLTGGSAYGLDVASGIMRFLEERSRGFETGWGIVPIVCGAALFDLNVGDAHAHPSAQQGYDACLAASESSSTPLARGCVGAGTGATVGKLLGATRAMKSGIGSTALEVDELVVGAIVAVNAAGTIVDTTGMPLAGCLSEDGGHIESVTSSARALVTPSLNPFASVTNTTLACVITNAKLTKAQAKRVAICAHDGFARAIRPVHTSFDGDTVFVLATGEVDVASDGVGALAADACEEAIHDAALSAQGAYDLKANRDIV